MKGLAPTPHALRIMHALLCTSTRYADVMGFYMKICTTSYLTRWLRSGVSILLPTAVVPAFLP